MTVNIMYMVLFHAKIKLKNVATNRELRALKILLLWSIIELSSKVAKLTQKQKNMSARWDAGHENRSKRNGKNSLVFSQKRMNLD